LADLLADEDRRRALYDHPRRMEFAAHALAEVLDERGAGGCAVATDPNGM
jgi:hypothetical protein